MYYYLIIMCISHWLPLYNKIMTGKQSKAIEILTKTPDKSVGEAMLEAGYSPSVTKTPAILTKSKAYQELIMPIMKEHGVTIKQYVKNIGDAMVAEKQNQFTGEINPDLGMRLMANKQAEKLLKVDQLVGTSDTEKALSKEDMAILMNESDTIELTKLVFNKLG